MIAFFFYCYITICPWVAYNSTHILFQFYKTDIQCRVTGLSAQGCTRLKSRCWPGSALRGSGEEYASKLIRMLAEFSSLPPWYWSPNSLLAVMWSLLPAPGSHPHSFSHGPLEHEVQQEHWGLLMLSNLSDFLFCHQSEKKLCFKGSCN